MTAFRQRPMADGVAVGMADVAVLSVMGVLVVVLTCSVLVLLEAGSNMLGVVAASELVVADAEVVEDSGLDEDMGLVADVETSLEVADALVSEAVIGVEVSVLDVSGLLEVGTGISVVVVIVLSGMAVLVGSTDTAVVLLTVCVDSSVVGSIDVLAEVGLDWAAELARLEETELVDVAIPTVVEVETAKDDGFCLQGPAVARATRADNKANVTRIAKGSNERTRRFTG